ncbi:MAG: hypothetical protein PHV37_04295 [Candidatus Gastranaerophilales bacterium]|nr:hypothetical protein [Candidatus Gastranaerophilales bacterium]
MTDNFNDENGLVPEIQVEVTDNNQQIPLTMSQNIQNTLSVHNNDEYAHQSILDAVSVQGSKVTQLTTMTINNNTLLNNRCELIEEQVAADKNGYADVPFSVGEPTIDVHSVNKAYMVNYVTNRINEISDNLFDFKISDKAQNDDWKPADGNWLDGNIYISAYQYLLNQYNSGTLTTDANSYVDSTNTISNKNVICNVSPKLFRIVESANAVAVDELYAATNSAWYYLLDIENRQFKLPRCENFMQLTGIVANAGLYKEAGLPNIVGEAWSGAALSHDTGCFKVTNQVSRGSGGADYAPSVLNFNASLVNKMYGNSESVQPRANKMVLYFKVK